MYFIHFLSSFFHNTFDVISYKFNKGMDDLLLYEPFILILLHGLYMNVTRFK